MHLALIWRLLVLIGVANAVPILAKDMLGPRLAYPLDGHLHLADGRRILGSAKTVRGVLLALAATAILSPLIGLDWQIGLVIGAAAMAGDLLASFLKRRLGRPVSGMALGLDQIPESLLPVIACTFFFPLRLADIALVVGLFFVGELLLSRLLYRLHLRDRPY